jgi:ATP adenylyltransferase
MSHIYQPVMLMALLSKGGKCHEREIASELLTRDESQIEYYTQITNNMVERVLRDHQIVERDRTTRTYRLWGYETLTTEQKDALKNLCQKRLDTFIEARGRAIYDHRRVSVGYISGTLNTKYSNEHGFVVSCVEYLRMKKRSKLTTSCPGILGAQMT